MQRKTGSWHLMGRRSFPGSSLGCRAQRRRRLMQQVSQLSNKVEQTKGKWKGGLMKRFRKSSTTALNSTCLSSSKRDDSELISFTQSFNPIDGDSSPRNAGFKEACSDSSFEYVNKTHRIGEWGHWNYLDSNSDYVLNSNSAYKEQGNVDEKPVSEGKVMTSEKCRGFLKFMSWVSIQGHSKPGKKRSQKMSAGVCHDVVNSIERLQLEQYTEKANNCSKTKEELAASAEKWEVPSSLNMLCDKKEAGKSFECYKLTCSGGGKLMGRKVSQNKRLSVPNSEVFLKKSASDLHPANNCETNTNHEDRKSKHKAANTTGSQLLKKLIPLVRMSKRNDVLKTGRNEAVEASSRRSWRSRTIVPAVQVISSESNNLHSAESVSSTGKPAGTIKVVGTYSKPPPENVFSRSSSNDYPFTEIGSSLLGKLNATRSNLHETNLRCTRVGLPLITSNHEQRSAVTREAGPGYSADLALLNAKIDMRFEQVLTAIDVKRSAQSQLQTCKMVDDEKESIHSRLIDSSTSDLGTVEMELSPLKNCVSMSQLADAPIIKEFKGAVGDAHLKIRVLAGLLTVEKGAKMASARDFQSKKMILSMGMMGAQMLEGELSLEKPWHFKYLLDYCVSSIFFNGPHSSSHCICSRQSSFSSYYKSAIFDSFCNDMDFASVTFDSFCDEATLAVEELIGSKAKGWSDTLTNMFWNCAVCCFQVHKLIVAICKCERTVQILHPHRGTRYDASAMDPLDTGNFNAFHKKVLFTIFSGFMLEGKVVCKSQVYLQPKVATVIL